MRSVKRYVNEDGTSNIESSFLSCEKDSETIIRKLFIDSYPYSDDLKRLLLINAKDCLDNKTNPKYLEKIKNTSVSDLIEQQYIRFNPKLEFGENEELKNYLIFSYESFTPNLTNEYYRNTLISIDVICHTNYWDLGNFRQRPIKIAGYIDGILNKTKLSGIGQLNFVSCSEMIISSELSGYSLKYMAIHSDDDHIEPEEDE